MSLTVSIPDDLAERLSASGDNVERRVLEALALDEFRRQRMTRAELKHLLGFATHGELDIFLLEHGVVGRYTESDLAHDRADLRRLGF